MCFVFANVFPCFEPSLRRRRPLNLSSSSVDGPWASQIPRIGKIIFQSCWISTSVPWSNNGQYDVPLFFFHRRRRCTRFHRGDVPNAMGWRLFFEEEMCSLQDRSYSLEEEINSLEEENTSKCTKFKAHSWYLWPIKVSPCKAFPSPYSLISLSLCNMVPR